MMRGLFQWDSPLCYRLFPNECRWLLLFTLTLAGVMVVSSLISIILLLSEIEAALTISPTYGLWLGRIFLFAVGLSPLFAIRMSYVYGFKRMLVMGCLIFLLGAIFTPFTHHYYLMLCFRLVGGLGGGIVISLSLAIIDRTTPRSIKEVVLAISSSATFGIGIALGLLYSGYIGQLGKWELMSLPDICLAIPVVLLTLLLCPERPHEKKPPYDLVSLFSLFTLAFFLFLIVTQVKEPWNTLGWRSGFIISCFVIAGLSFTVLIAATFIRKYPLLDHRLIKDPIFIAGCIGMAIVGVMIFGVTLTSIGMLENVFGYEKWTVGWLLSTIGFIYCFGGIIPSLCIKRVKPVVFVLIGIALITISCFASQSITIHSDKRELFAIFGMRACGVALALGPITAFALTDLSPDIAPRGVAIISFVRQMGGAFGSGIIQTIQMTREAAYRFPITNKVKIASLLDAIWIFGWIFGGLLLLMVAVLTWHRWKAAPTRRYS